MTANHPILEVQDLQVARQGQLVLDVPSLLIHKGETLALLGPNGAGKSTLLYTLAWLMSPLRGRLIFKNKMIHTSAEVFSYRRAITMVFQQPLLFKGSVFENVASGLKFRGEKSEKIAAEVAEVLEIFGISHLGHRPARNISGGEAQRASLARAFALRPEIIFLDEPFSSLDEPTRNNMIDDLERILRERGATAILATHDRLEALRLADRIAVMNAGEIAQIGGGQEVINQPVNELVASFVGMETVFAGQITRAEGGSFIISLAGREIEVAGVACPGERAVCCLRPDQVTIWENTDHRKISARNIFPARITRITPLGPFFRVALDCGFPLVAFVTSQAREDLDLCEGKEVVASFKATA
ncbi:MAG: ABC transporter ATP-binding protein, partial [Smithellaceae bacterium]|nr:ABC transporter ATP-binding protein [Smithellaceae bacterium]